MPSLIPPAPGSPPHARGSVACPRRAPPPSGRPARRAGEGRRRPPDGGRGGRGGGGSRRGPPPPAGGGPPPPRGAGAHPPSIRWRSLVEPLVIPPAMPHVPRERRPAGLSAEIDYYEIAVRQFPQAILPASLGLQTTVWSYGAIDCPDSFNYPAFTIEATVDRPVRVERGSTSWWTPTATSCPTSCRSIRRSTGPTRAAARPPGTNAPGSARRPSPMPARCRSWSTCTAGTTPRRATGSPRPGTCRRPATSRPASRRSARSTTSSRRSSPTQWGQAWEPGTAVFQYANDQRPATLWFHDHTLGMTRLNVYAGPAGFLPPPGWRVGPPGRRLARTGARPRRRPGTAIYEIPLAIQDRSFTADGALFYPSSRAVFDGFAGPYIPESDVSPIWNPEVFGDAMVVNGRTWPLLEVEPRRYRLRFLNGCNSRFLILKLASDPRAPRPVRRRCPFSRSGPTAASCRRRSPSTSSCWRRPSAPTSSSISARLSPGAELFLINEGPDEPFGGGLVGTDFPPADPETTGQVLKLVVVSPMGEDASLPVDQLTLPAPAELGPEAVTRRVSLNEEVSKILAGVGPTEAVLGTVDEEGRPIHLDWDEPITETPVLTRSRSGSCTTSPRTPTRSTSTRCSSRCWTGSRSRGRRAARAVGDRCQRHGHRLPRRDHPRQSPFRSPGALRLALPHPRARGQRDDAPAPRRAVSRDRPGRAEGAVPSEASRHVGNILTPGDHRHAEAPATCAPEVLEERRSGLLLGGELVRGHQLDRWPRKDAFAAVCALVHHHLTEGEHVVDRRDEPAAARFEDGRPRVAAIARSSQDDELASDHIRPVAGWKPVELALRHPEPGVLHPERREDALMKKRRQRLAGARAISTPRISPPCGIANAPPADERVEGAQAPHELVGVTCERPLASVSRASVIAFRRGLVGAMKPTSP